MQDLIRILHKSGYSCVIRNNGATRTFTQRGVADLYHLLKNEPTFLAGAQIADKVVGKAAASLLILGGVGELHTDIISTPALELLRKSSVKVEFDHEVPHIENRAKNGWCPLEKRCFEETSAESCQARIEAFFAEMKGN